nr:alpha-mannosidase [uncultured Eisenbergiella sp.]
MSKVTVHIISHSHWDREWYMPLEKHKLKLVDLIDDNLEMLSQNPEYRSFHLDGQTIVLDDYLEICPGKKEEIKKLVKEGRLVTGPWYVLQDEFLTSGEANVRNLLTGCREAEEYGKNCGIGYFPDAFGNAGQMPQLLKQAGMEAVVFGRGVKPVGFNNETGTGEYESAYSEMYWEAPDGSRLLGILFANWYNNGMEIPVEEESARKFWDEKLKSALQYASTNELLFMNGCDHQPVQKTLPQAMETAKRLYPDITFVHSNFPDYIARIKEAAENKLTTVKGELTSQDTDGYTTLVNTCSARIYLKQDNREAETLLEKTAEPLCTMAASLCKEGYRYPEQKLQYAWKILMQNHPHDSICGCSVDEVNEEMGIRFARSRQAAEELIQEAAAHIAGNLDASAFTRPGSACYPFAVFNTTGWKRTGIVTAQVDVGRDYEASLPEAYAHMDSLTLPVFCLMNGKGESIPCSVEDRGAVFDYELPKDSFRRPFMARRLKVTFEAEAIPGEGYAVYALLPEKDGKPAADAGSLITGKNRMENAHIRVVIQKDGTLEVTDKRNGKKYRDLCYFEDTLDAGNEYIYFCPDGNRAVLSKGGEAQIRPAEDEPFRAVYEIRHKLRIPVSADERLEQEQKQMVDFRDRKAGRSREEREMEICSFITLTRQGRKVEIRTEFENTARDHRLRVIVPSGLSSTSHYADSVFEVVKRPNRHKAGWKNPSGCEHQQYVCAVCDEQGGIAVANKGLYEYEVLPDQENALAVTLLRSVGEMGDWGVFPTPQAQCLGKQIVEYELIFFDGCFPDSGAYEEASMFQAPWITAAFPWNKENGEGLLPSSNSLFEWEGRGIYLTGLKKKDGAADIMVRFFNGTGEERELYLKLPEGCGTCYGSDVLEREGAALHGKEGEYRLMVRPYAIITIGMKE